MAVRAGLMSEDGANAWLESYGETAKRNSAFGSCNYYTYLAGRS